MLNFVIKTLYQRSDNAAATQSEIPTRQQLLAPYKRKQATYSPWSTEHLWVELVEEILGQKGKEAIRTQNSLDGTGDLT